MSKKEQLRTRNSSRIEMLRLYVEHTGFASCSHPPPSLTRKRQPVENDSRFLCCSEATIKRWPQQRSRLLSTQKLNRSLLSQRYYERLIMKMFKQRLENSLPRILWKTSKQGVINQNSKFPYNPVTTSMNITEYLLPEGHCPRPIIYTKRQKETYKDLCCQEINNITYKMYITV